MVHVTALSSTMAPHKRRNHMNKGPLIRQQNMYGKCSIVTLAVAWNHDYRLSASNYDKALLLPRQIEESDGNGTLRERNSRVETPAVDCCRGNSTSQNVNAIHDGTSISQVVAVNMFCW